VSDAKAAGPASAHLPAVTYWEGTLGEETGGLAVRYLRRFEPVLLGATARCELLAEPARHIITAGGRRIRPLVLMGACDALGGDPGAALEPAVAVEFVHTASLIHDDIMDRSPQRRGVEAVHRRYGLRLAILTGDALCFAAFELAAGDSSVGGILAGACRQMCMGEAMPPGPEAAEKKTAVLFGVSARLGALAANAEPARVEAMRRYGRALGMAYQLRDDQLDGEADDDPMPHALRAAELAAQMPAGPATRLLSALALYAAHRAE
jgi:geranylgeranyl pyrophosphate synthase